MSEIGNNSRGLAGGQLKSIVERVERLEEDKKALLADIKEVYTEAKASGLNVKVIRKIVALRKKDQDDLEEEKAIMDVYLSNLGMEWLT